MPQIPLARPAALPPPHRAARTRLDAAREAHAENPADRRNAHLAGFAFRFGPASTAPPMFGPVARPAPGETWTLAQTLQEIHLRKLTLVATSRGVHLRRRGLGSDVALDTALAQFAGPLRVWLRLGGADGEVPAPWDARGWDDATRLFAAWFGLLFRPAAFPLALRAGERIADWARFRSSVAARLAEGPASPHAARLTDDLAGLYARFGRAAEQLRVPEPRPSMAA